MNVHRDQGIVEHFNQSLSEKLFSIQYSREMNFKKLEKQDVDTIKEKVVNAKPSTNYSRPVGLKENKLDYSVNVRYLLASGKLEGGQKRATDPNWSLKVFNIENSIVRENEPVLYYLKDGPKRGFLTEELMIIPKGTVMSPERLS